MTDPTLPGEDPEDVVLAGEYVLGLLTPEEAALLEREAASRPTLAAEIATWGARLAPLLAQVPPAIPPRELWERVQAGAFRGAAHGPGAAVPRSRAAAAAAVRRPGAWNSLAVWRMAAGGFAAAAAVAGIALLRQPGPGLPVAALEPTSGAAPAIVATRLADGRLVLHPLATLPVQAGHALELWSLPAGATRPVSLGLLPPAGTVLAAARTPRAEGRLLVSLEPPGGAPDGLPTGAVLWAGLMQPPG